MDKDVNFSDFMTVYKASKYLGVPMGTLRKWILDGSIKFRRHPINGYRLIYIDDLKELLWKLKAEKKL